MSGARERDDQTCSASGGYGRRTISAHIRQLPRLAWLLAGVLLFLAAWSAQAQSPGAEWAWPLASPLATGRSPLAAVDISGQVHLLWAEATPEDGSLRLLWVAPPADHPTVLAEGLPSGRAPGLALPHPGYALAARTQVVAAWAAPEADGWAVTAYSPAGQQLDRWQVPQEAPLWTFGLLADGSLVAAWLSPEGLHVHHQGQKWTVPLPPAQVSSVERLSVALHQQGTGYVAWSLRAQEPGGGGLWYASFGPEPRPVQVAPQGTLADAQVGPDGVLHLIWLAGDGLHYANSVAPDSRGLAVRGLPRGASVALAASEGAVAHLAWVTAGEVWRSVSADWELARTAYRPEGEPQGLALAVDERSSPRLVWAERDPDTASARLRLLRPLMPTPALQVTWPLADQVLTGDSIAQVVTNLPPGDWQRVEFYLQEEDPRGGQAGVLRELGIVRDGSAGWRVPLSVEGLAPGRRYRVVALGVGHEARVTRAVGGWFRISPREQLWLWPQPWQPALSGVATLAISPPTGAERLAWLELYLASAHTHALQQAAQGSGARPPADHYVTLSVEGSLDRPVVRLDTRTLPDGTYHATVRGHTADGRVIEGSAAQPLVIDNTLAPTLGSIRARLLDAATGQLELLAEPGDPHRWPERVTFYLQREAESAFRGSEPETADLVYAGQARWTEEGWLAVVRPEPHWYDQRWLIWAVACDARDVCSTLPAEEPRLLWASERPVLLLAQPSGAAPLRGIEPVRLAMGPDTERVAAASAWLEHADGTLVWIGDLASDGRQWSLLWDTSSQRDGTYRLLVIGTLDNGAQLPVWSPMLRLANREALWRITTPGAGQRLRGWTPVSVAALGETAVARVTFYHRDASGALAPIGVGQPHQQQWSVLWNTYGALDGNHVVVAEIETAAGELVYLEQPVEVQNGRPNISLLRGPSAAPVRGTERLVWYAQHPARKPVTVSLEYSPDGGGHWLPLAQDLAAGVSFSWDSATFPDSDAAFVRITATDGEYYRQAIHGPFTVANVNDAPSVVLSRPRAGETLGRNAEIAWSAADADGDAVTVALYYRREQGPWQLVADGLPVTGRYSWDTSALPPGRGYALRAVARDRAGAVGIDLADELTIVDNTAPSVELVWPNDRTSLSSEAVILWRTHDADGDRLLIDLYYSDNGGITWYPLAEDLPDSGYYVWQVAFLPPGGAYRLRVVARDAHARAVAESRGVFTVGAEQPPEIELLAPAAGDRLSGVFPIRWWTVGRAPEAVAIDILVRISAWGEWRPLAEDLSPDELFLWDTRRLSEGLYDLMARARLGERRSVSNVVTGVRVRNARERPLEIELDVPVGGELWSGLREVRWKLVGAAGRALVASLELSQDGGETWRPLATVAADQQRYLWQTAAWPDGQRYLLRITVTDGEVSASATTSGVFSLANEGGYPPRVTIASPTLAGEVQAGSLVTWIAEDPDGNPLLLDLLLSDNDGQSWRKIASQLLDAGEHPLEVPLEAERAYRVALVACDGLQRTWVASASFGAQTLERLRPHVELLRPQRRELVSGSTPILWQASDPAGLTLNIDLAFSPDGGQTWEAFATNLENTSRYDWDTRSLPNGTYLVRVTADNGRAQRSAVSEPIQVANPGGAPPYLSWAGAGVSALQSGAYEILWRAADPDGGVVTLTLAYSLGPHGPWSTLAHRLPNTGRYVWDASSVPTADDIWLRLTASDGRWASTIVSEAPAHVRHPGGPHIELVAPRGGEVLTGAHTLRWRVRDGGEATQVTLQHSLDGGRTWTDLAAGLPGVGTLTWDTAEIPDGSTVLLRAIAARGSGEAIATLQTPVLVRGNEDRGSLPTPFR